MRALQSQRGPTFDVLMNDTHLRSSKQQTEHHSITWTDANTLAVLGGAAHLCDAGSSERHDDGHHVDGQLELKEFGDAVVHVAPPHDGFDDAGKVVVGQDNVGRLLGNIGAGDTLETERRERSFFFFFCSTSPLQRDWRPTHHGKADVSFLQGRTVVCPISCHGHHLSLFNHCAVNDSWYKGNTKDAKNAKAQALVDSFRPTPPSRTFDQSVFVCGGRPRQHSEFGPELVDSFLFNLEIEET